MSEQPIIQKLTNMLMSQKSAGHYLPLRILRASPNHSMFPILLTGLSEEYSPKAKLEIAGRAVTADILTRRGETGFRRDDATSPLR